jgi:hypothetical protein
MQAQRVERERDDKRERKRERLWIKKEDGYATTEMS